MQIRKEILRLPEGQFYSELQFWNDPDDKQRLLKIYQNWVELSNEIKELGGRRVNIPEVLSESVFCLHFSAGRLIGSIPGANASFDCFDIDSHKRIQVKACSISEDLTSFGPKSVWDQLFFIHFYPNGTYDGCYNIYEIPNNLIYSHKINKNQTFLQQQQQLRRPRFSLMKDIIGPHKIKTRIQGDLNACDTEDQNSA